VPSLWCEQALLPGGWARDVRMRVAEGLIADVQTGAAPEPGDERSAIAIPGLANVHSHAFQRGMAGLTERRSADGDDFWTWRSLMYRFLETLTPDDVEAITAQAYAEMLEAGFTRVGEFHYLHHDPSGARYADPAEMAARIAAAAAQTGIGLTLLPVFYAHADFGGAPPAHNQRRFVNDIDGFARLIEAAIKHQHGDALTGVAIHSLRAATPDEIAAIVALGRGPIHIHAAEQMREVEASLAHLGARPVEWLLDNASIDARWCLVHATHMNDRETARLAASDAVAGLCPITEANLGDGVFPAVSYLDLGGRIGVGSDSNVFIDAAEELRTLEYSQRLTHRRRCVLADDQTPSVGRRLFDSASAGGAQALGVATGIAPGMSADIVALDATHPSLADANGDTTLDAWLFAARAGAIDSVWRGGVKVVSNGRCIDAPAIATRYRATLAKLQSA
jgi:formiminoglutamate deiminase